MTEEEYEQNCAICQMEKYCHENSKLCDYIELPPHGRLIDADELKSAWDDSETGGSLDAMSTPVPIIRALIDDAPTIIEAEEGENEN